MRKNVQIPIEIFQKLVDYCVLGKTEAKEEIRSFLMNKVERLILHDCFSDYKACTSKAEKADALYEYRIRKKLTRSQ